MSQPANPNDSDDSLSAVPPRRRHCVGRHPSTRRSRAPSRLHPEDGDSKVSLLGVPEGTVKISGGEFNAVGGNQIRLEVNLNGLTQNSKAYSTASEDYNVDAAYIHDDENERTELRRPSPPAGIRDFYPIPHGSKRGMPQKVRRQKEPSEGINTVYFRSLASKRRGSPLWIPEPNKQLSVEYQRNGLVICDVGIITDRGWFDSLFNIRLPPDHPLSINSEDLPRNFTPLEIKSNHISKYSEFKQGSSLSSESIRVLFGDNSSSQGLVFESSASEGAILTLPDGSNSEDLGNKKKLRDYLSIHGEEMYRCAMIEHGRIFRNGDLRVVTGFDKTASWGMAAFANSTSQQGRSFRLKFQHGCGTGRSHSWESSGTAEVKAGPDEREVIALRMGDPSQQDVEYENQAVFVRTENITLNPSIWKELVSESGAGEQEASDDDSDLQEGPYARPHPPHHRTDGGESSGCQTLRETNSSHPSAHGSRSYSSSSTNTLTAHPSNGINAILLKLNPSARMAITEDDVWISVLKESDAIIPSVETLWTRLVESYRVSLEDGVATLEKLQDEVSPIHNEPAINAFDLATVGYDRNMISYAESEPKPKIEEEGNMFQTKPSEYNKAIFETKQEAYSAVKLEDLDSMDVYVQQHNVSSGSGFTPLEPEIDNHDGFSDPDTVATKGSHLIDETFWNPSSPKLAENVPDQRVKTHMVFQSIVKSRKTWKALRGGEVVWPPELEAALLEGLENYRPDNSREAHLLGRYPMRNRFLSDWIYEKTGKRRTAKQVGSRLQQIRASYGGKEVEREFSNTLMSRVWKGLTIFTDDTPSASSSIPGLQLIPEFFRSAKPRKESRRPMTEFWT